LIYFGYTLTKGLWLNDLGPVGFWVADVASFVVVPILLILVFRLPLRMPELRDKRNDRTEGSWILIAVNGFLIAFALFMIFFLSRVAFARWGIDESVILPPKIVYEGRIAKDGIWYYVDTVYFALSAALVEEYIFRFVLRRALLPYTSAALPFVLVSATTFALVHWAGGLQNLFAAFFGGLLLASVYLKSGDLRLPIVGHAFYWLRLLFR
jgi:membrane protease YdiL (CAAX protease family)